MLQIYKSKTCKVVSMFLIFAILLTSVDLSFISFNKHVEAEEKKRLK